jgi:hypothetical protein
MDPERPGGTAEVPPVALEGSHDELALELSSGLLQRHASVNELIDDLVQASIEILISQERPLRKKAEADSVPQGARIPRRLVVG